MPSPLLFSDESALRLRAMLKGVTERDQPTKPDRGRVRVPTLVRALSATAVGGAEVGGDQCYDAVVLNVNSLTDEQEEAASVWLTILDGGTTASPVTVAAPVEGNAYYGLFAGNFDPDPTGTPDPRPRVFAVNPGAATAPTFGSATSGGFTLTVDSTWTNTGLLLSSLAAGTYELHCSVSVRVQSQFQGYMKLRLYDQTAGAVLPNTMVVAGWCEAGAPASVEQAQITTFLTLSVASTIELQVIRPTAGTWTLSNVATDSDLVFRWLKLG